MRNRHTQRTFDRITNVFLYPPSYLSNMGAIDHNDVYVNDNLLSEEMNLDSSMRFLSAKHLHAVGLINGLYQANDTIDLACDMSRDGCNRARCHLDFPGGKCFSSC